MVTSIGDKGVGSLIQNSLRKTDSNKRKLFGELSSGERSFSSDAAAGAISAQLEALDSALSQGTRNTRDFISVAELRGSAIDQVANLRDRQSELANQAANGTLSDQQRSVLNEEFQALEQEISRIEGTTTFNDINLFDGNTLTAQVGADSSENSQISLQSIDISSSTERNILTADAARTALDDIATDRTTLSNIRATDGAAVARLETAAENNESTRLALESANSRLRDVDVASTSAEITRQNILAQQQTGLLAQANQSQQTVLNLLR
ncbi:hypothetical protein MRY87_00445 [bacterium]|nr:hypothetical protein [bacterium]